MSHDFEGQKKSITNPLQVQKAKPALNPALSFLSIPIGATPAVQNLLSSPFYCIYSQKEERKEQLMVKRTKVEDQSCLTTSSSPLPAHTSTPWCPSTSCPAPLGYIKQLDKPGDRVGFRPASGNAPFWITLAEDVAREEVDGSGKARRGDHLVFRSNNSCDCGRLS